MPIYNCECEKCGNVEEVLSKKYLEEGELSENSCSKCGGNLAKIFTGTTSPGSFGFDGWRKGLTTTQQADKLMGSHNIEQV